ncbi:MAG TPA: aminopeptidase [Nevskiaceae bacterium]|nr:aminopeptidase [Nevskiaceae bacterium]
MRPTLPLVLATLLAGCAQIGYYAHLATGQASLLSRREPIEKIVADESRDAELRRRLAFVLDARAFAIARLHLPDNASYTLYADLQRPYAVWNVIAAREFSLEPVESCFPIAGCVAYRGFYSEERARQWAADLRAQGLDVDVSGTPAYSTLGWFDDPVLNTMMHWSDTILVNTVFHELAHQQLYVKGDTTFNESFATFVGDEGLRQFLAARGLADAQAAADRTREEQFTRLVLAARERLAALYAQPLKPEAMREAKRAAFERLRSDYARLRDTAWGGDRRYEGWFSRELNNATLAPFGLYDEFAPAFAALFATSGGDWDAFYAASRKLGDEGPERRKQEMARLRGQALPE